jgi:hypothetical protein
VVFFSSTSARNQKKKLEKKQVSRLPTNTKLKESTHSPNAHLCKQKRANYRPRFPLKELESSSATPQQAVQKQPGKMMTKCHPLQPPNPFLCGESSLQTER